MKFVDAIKDKAFEIEYNAKVRTAVNSAVSDEKAKFDKMLEDEREKTFQNGFDKGKLEGVSDEKAINRAYEKGVKVDFERGKKAGIKEALKTATVEKGKIIPSKPEPPECFKHYNKEPNKKCRACNFAQKCKGKK